MMSVFHKAAALVARENRGRLVKTMADEVVLEFTEPHSAVKAASELTGEFHEGAGRLDLPTPEFRTAFADERLDLIRIEANGTANANVRDLSLSHESVEEVLVDAERFCRPHHSLELLH